MNLHKIFISAPDTKNVEINGSNSFKYKTTCMLNYIPEEIGKFSFIDYPVILAGYVFPYINSSTIAVELALNGFNNDGLVVVSSKEKTGSVLRTKLSRINPYWFKIIEQEHNSSLKASFYLPENINRKKLTSLANVFG